jgi:hypothetical protein
MGVGDGEAMFVLIAEMGLRVGFGDPFEDDLGDAEAVELDSAKGSGED